MNSTQPNTPRRYLVTGAAGFIGSSLVDALVARGDEVVGVDSFDPFYEPSVKRANISGALASGRFRLVEGDIRDRALLESILAEGAFDCVVHLAARAGVRPSIDDPMLYQSVNVEGTASVLEAMRATGTRRLLFASSSSVYGNMHEVPFSETMRVDAPISPYAATKRAGELLCHTYHHLFGFDIACLRFFTVYGPRQRPEMAIHKFVARALRGDAIEVYGGGTSARDYTYIDDIVQGLLAIDGSFGGYGIYNLGESHPVELRRLIAVIGEATGRDPVTVDCPAQPGDVDITYADITAAQALGYRPSTTIEEGIRRFVAWMRARDEQAPALATTDAEIQTR